MAEYKYLEVEDQESIRSIWLNRPEVRNAFNPSVIRELTECGTGLSSEGAIRGIVLAGRGTHFCAGADLGWMREMARYTDQENYEDAMALAGMLEVLNSCPQRLIGRVQGGAFGGALGLIACCDTVVASSDAQFAFTEVRLGISPATIAPYVMSKIGAGNARDLFLSARRFSAEEALRMGLVHRVVDAAMLDNAIAEELELCRACAPRAVIQTKALISSLHLASNEEVMQFTARLIAELRAAKEGQEGLNAFFEKRKPYWAE